MKNHNIDKGSLSYDMVIVPPEGGTIMINSNAYDYINVLDKAADAAWIRNDAIANNIANVDTPGYKRQDVDFEGELQRALGNSKYTSMDSSHHKREAACTTSISRRHQQASYSSGCNVVFGKYS